MAKTQAVQKPSPQAVKKIQELYVTLKGYQSARLVYDRLFTAADRERYDEQELGKKHIVDIWAQMRKLSQPRAALEIALKLDLLIPSTYDWLLKEICEKGPAAGVADYPVWDRDQRKLFYKGKVVRTVRSLTVASYITAILDSFENHGWPTRIANPLPAFADKQRKREAVANLNKGLIRIRFRSDGEGEGILCKPRAASAPPVAPCLDLAGSFRENPGSSIIEPRTSCRFCP